MTANNNEHIECFHVLGMIPKVIYSFEHPYDVSAIVICPSERGN